MNVRPTGLTGGARLVLWGAIAALLLAPLIAMRFTREVTWTSSDFAVATLLLVGAGAVFEIGCRIPAVAKRRALFGAAVLTAVAAVWAQGAVGIV